MKSESKPQRTASARPTGALGCVDSGENRYLAKTMFFRFLEILENVF
jgi:hypothetical protein